MSEIEGLRDEVRTLRTEVAHQRRWSRGITGLAAVIVGLVALGGASTPKQVLRADRIEIGSGDPGIVLEQGPEGPTITLSDGDERTTRLSMAGLELTITAAEPSDMPTLADPGLGEEDPRKETGLPVTIDVGTDVYVTHVEISCPSGFRRRARFSEGRAVMQVPSDAGLCNARFGGGATITKVGVEPGDDLICRRLGTSFLTCQKHIRPLNVE